MGRHVTLAELGELLNVETPAKKEHHLRSGFSNHRVQIPHVLSDCVVYGAISPTIFIFYLFLFLANTGIQ